MLKLRLAFGLALIVAVLTACVGLVQGVRPLTVLYRTFTSLLVFGVCGFLVGFLAEKVFDRSGGAEVKQKGQNVDIISKDGLEDGDELLNPTHVAKPFSPLIPDDFEQLSTKQ